MKRNWDIIREILIAVEDLEPEKNLTLSDFDTDRAHDISYHVGKSRPRQLHTPERQLLKQVGFPVNQILKISLACFGMRKIAGVKMIRC